MLVGVLNLLHPLLLLHIDVSVAKSPVHITWNAKTGLAKVPRSPIKTMCDSSPLSCWWSWESRLDYELIPLPYGLPPTFNYPQLASTQNPAINMSSSSAVLAASVGAAALYVTLVRSPPSRWRMVVKTASTSLLSATAAMRGGATSPSGSPGVGITRRCLPRMGRRDVFSLRTG